MTSYLYNNIRYYHNKFKIGYYECYYEYFFYDDTYHIYLKNYDLEDEDNPYQYTDINLKIAKQKLRNTLKEIILNNEINNLIKDNYKIFINLPDILKDCFLGVGYHITPIQNTHNILQKGLIPSYIPETETINASTIIDANKPQKININRLNCVYLHPHMNNECFSPFEKYYKNNSLLAINISTFTNNSYIASSGLGSFCMYEKTDDINLSDLNKYGKLYWKHSKKLTDYLINPPKNSSYDLSEIIVNDIILPEFITNLGFWDANSIFHPTQYFKNFIKDKYKENYTDILSLYP